ncbi:hypothetical protein [Actinobaculum sp. 352]|uniref:hypothetical protein n=1 Tax=Actinobaculum sp. 352 TaxID=2490946 RepID=UPI000F7D97A0|nr:hypothetical protein [Actinobaculum sp. 352]RTE49349.1 hypothetical protein EKN07_07215 [Actinobaculum sp. 352]
MTTDDELAYKYFGAPITDWEALWEAISLKLAAFPPRGTRLKGYQTRMLARACFDPGTQYASYAAADNADDRDCARRYADHCLDIINAAYILQYTDPTTKDQLIAVARDYYVMRWNRPDIDWVRLLDREGRGHLIDATATKPEHDPAESAGIALAWIASLLAQDRIRISRYYTAHAKETAR